MSEVPDVSVSVQSGGKPIINSGLARTHIVIGAASSGVYTAREVNNTTLISNYTSGDAVKAAARAIDRSSANAIFVRRNHTAVAATKTTTTDISGTALAVVSGTPNGAYELILTIDNGDTVVSGNVTYTASKDNGETEVAGTLASTGVIADILGTGLTVTFNPPDGELVASATDIRAKFLAHFANAVAHNSADAAAIAIITLGVPTNNAQALAVLNQCRSALILHEDNATVHDSFDIENVPTAGAATTEQEARLLAINLKTKYNLHRQATFPDQVEGLLAYTASSVGIQSYNDSTLDPAGIAQLDGYPSAITITNDGSGTPADAPATADIAGFDEDGAAQTETGVAVPQTGATVTSTKKWRGTGLTVTYAAGDGNGAALAIGLPDAAHNSADVTNVVTAADPSSGTLEADDSVLVSTTDPSPAILSLTTTGSGTLEPSASGTPLETFRARIEFLTAGTIGTEDDGSITYRVSLDNGNTWQPTASLGVAESIVVVDKRVDGTSTTTGVTLALTATETVDTDTVITFRTTGPRVAIADVLLGIDAAAGSAYKQRGWKFVHIVGDYSASEMAQVQEKLDTLQTKKQWFYGFMQFPDKREYESESDWMTRIVADRATLDADRVAPSAGYVRNFTCPLTNRLDRRPVAWTDVVRRLCINANVESGRKIDGPIGSEVNGKVGGETASGDVTLYEDGERVEYDADVDSTLANARITVARTFTGQGLGVFINGSRLGTGPASKFTRTRDRELNDRISRALNAEGIRTLLENVRRNPGVYPTEVPARPGDPGTILESEALNLEREMQSAAAGAVIGLVSSIVVTVGRTDNLTGQSGATAVPRRISYTCEVDGQPVIEGADILQIFNG